MLQEIAWYIMLEIGWYMMVEIRQSSVNLSLLSYVTPDDPDQGSRELAQLDRARASFEEKMERRHGVLNLQSA